MNYITENNNQKMSNLFHAKAVLTCLDIDVYQIPNLLCQYNANMTTCNSNIFIILSFSTKTINSYCYNGKDSINY